MKRRLVALSIAVGVSIPLALSNKPGNLEAASAYKDTGTVAPNAAQRAEDASQKGNAGASERGLPATSRTTRDNLVHVNARKPSPMPSAVQPGTHNVLKTR